MLLAVTACGSPSAPRPAATGPVAVPVPSATAAPVLAACARLLAALPDQLDTGVTRRPVTGDPTRTAAWGDPPVTLRCGVPPPDQTQTPLIVDGLRLVTLELPGEVRYTTQDRQVNATLEIPRSYQSQADVLLPLVSALKTLPPGAATPGS